MRVRKNIKNLLGIVWISFSGHLFATFSGEDIQPAFPMISSGNSAVALTCDGTLHITTADDALHMTTAENLVIKNMGKIAAKNLIVEANTIKLSGAIEAAGNIELTANEITCENVPIFSGIMQGI